MALSTPASDTSLAPVIVPREAARGSSLYRDAWRRLLRNRLAVAGGAVVILLCVVAIFADVIAPQSYTKANFGHLYESPNREFPLGTDQLGRDVLSRLIYGARVSMLVGLGAQVIIVLIGVPIGALSGYVGGRTDLLLTRFVDVMYAFPRLLFVILVMSMLGAGLVNIFIALGLTGWVGIARQTRAQVLSIKEKEFVEAARAAGASSTRIITRHILPNCIGPIVVNTTLGIAAAIVTESTLSFLGFGLQKPATSWGNMLADSEGYYSHNTHLLYFPGLMILITVLCVNFLGDGLRDAFDPQSHH